MAWNDFDDDSTDDNRPRLAKPGTLADGESMTVEITAEPDMVDTDYEEALRFDAEFLEADHDGDFDGEGPFSEGDECRVLSWSNRFRRALAGAVGSEPVGATVTITRHGEGYETDYTVDTE